ncbi:MAG: hypothetical protein ACK4Z8_17180 [Novosphingobium sp.]
MTPRLDSTLAWKTATRLVATNRDVLMAIAGVFFLLPGLFGSLVLPRPEFGDGMTDKQMAEAILRFYGDAGPVLILLSIPMFLGFMTMLKVMLDPARPTVGTSIARCLRLLPTYLGAHILSTFGMTLIWLVLLSVLTLLLPAVLAIFLSIVLLTYPASRLILVTPEIVASEVRSPLRAITNSIRDTQGAYFGILGYFGPALTLFMVLYGLIMIFVGVVLVQTTEGETQRMLSEGIIALLFAVGYTYLAAMLSSVWLQLAPRHQSPELPLS